MMETAACTHGGEMREGEKTRDARVEERRSLWWKGREAREESLGRRGGRSLVESAALSVVKRERGTDEMKNE